MADVRNYPTRTDEWEKNIRKHKLSFVYKFIFVLVVLLSLLVLIIIQYRNHIYTSYNTQTSLEIEYIRGTTNIQLGENIVTYSNDGARCMDTKGNLLWNQTFEMQDLMLATSKNVVAFADYNGRSVYILDSTQKLGEITTTMPIRNIAVSENGRVAVSVADTKVTWVNIYNKEGTLEYEIRTTMNQSGYPVSFDMSNNGELLEVSYIYVDSGVVKSHVAFYNLGAVGANQSDYYVSGYIYPDTIVPKVEFMNNDTAFAIGDDRLILYKGNQVPISEATYMFEEEIKAVYSNENYIGVLFASDLQEHQYKFEVYSSDATRVGKYYFSSDFIDIFFGEDKFVVYGSKECIIQSFQGITKFEGEFEKSVNLMYQIGKGLGFRYLIMTNDSMDVIQLE